MPASLPSGPGSPRDVPPAPGEFPVDPATLPEPIRDELLAPDPVAIDTASRELRDGVNRCPKCGSTEIRQRAGTDKLVCLYCRHEWTAARVEEAFGLGEGIGELKGTQIASGAQNIAADAASLRTYHCAGCGADVVVNTETAMTARCHWCRHMLGVNEQIDNGAVPDAVLPFHIKKDDAVARIRQFVGKRRMFALKAFKEEFAPENVLGVYLPYMVVDANASADVAGFGEVETRRYTRGEGKDQKTYYDADVYRVQRHVDFTVDDLTLESSAKRGNLDTQANTHNVINAILPFDTKNAVKWNASYLVGYTSEKRDRDVEHLHPRLEDQLLSIARAQVQASVRRYGRGVRWEQERLDVHGTRWVAMYLPVWLYSYHQPGRGGGMLHYIAVNGRTGETMGSVPVQQWKLVTAALAVGTFVEALVLWFIGR
ncbi:TFIIB-type zinc ribbon-containing protein [Acidovorax sp. SDU_ACID1]|uniref:TFIIB-type zinc ribbon-containing protein n=1 Tax=Acidovorax sp. SDU_ACID1 TaxID=3136632 RepID=UPI0038735E3C